eukprot:3114527-Lingulodinium_polyedra.AAC.1
MREIQGWWRDKLNLDPDCSFKDKDGRVRRLYVVPPRSAAERPLYAAMGKVKEVLERRRAAMAAP